MFKRGDLVVVTNPVPIESSNNTKHKLYEVDGVIENIPIESILNAPGEVIRGTEHIIAAHVNIFHLNKICIFLEGELSPL